jgi:hypothetical protein
MASLLVMVIVTEIMLRLTLRLGTPVLYQRDADAGYIPVPSQDVHRFGVSTHINAFGMRSEHILPHKTEGTYVFFVGDSVAYGNGPPGSVYESSARSQERKFITRCPAAG